MSGFYDALETRAPDQREAALFVTLRDHLSHAKAHAPYFARTLARIDPRSVTGRAALAAVPILRKSELFAAQQAAPPFGGLLTVPVNRLARVFQSPGPLYDAEGHGRDYWRFARALFAAGVRRGDIILGSFSYHLTPAGSMVESAAHALGCAVVPGGVGNSELQARIVAEVKPTAYAGTPSFLKILLDKAAELGSDVSSLRRGMVSGEALPTPLREHLSGRGIEVYQCYATADVGLIAYESEAREGLIVDEGVCVEIVEPGGSKPVADGEVGEVVVTVFTKEYPLVRFATGDLSAVLPGASPCGRTNMRIRGWLGRADQSTKVRGMFVHPNQVMAVQARHPEATKVRLVVTQDDGRDVMTLYCEAVGGRSAQAEAIAATLHALCKMHGEVSFVAPGSLPIDGRIIEDQRKLA